MTILLPVVSFAAGERCEVALGAVPVTSIEDVKTAIKASFAARAELPASLDPFIHDFASNVDVALLAGERLPNWSDFDKLEKLRVSWQALVATDEQFLNRYIRYKGAQRLFAQPELAAVAKAIKKGLRKIKYAPTEYGLRKAYFAKLMALKDFLPAELVAQLQNLPSDSREIGLPAQGAQFLTKSEAVFLERFQRVTGMTFEDYETKLRASTDPLIQKAIAILDADQVQIIMRRPESGRFWVPKVGFQNQFVTGSSRGSLSENGRNTAEALLYGVNAIPEYSTHDAEFKPKYGTLKLDPASGVVSDNGSSSQYGPDIYKFRTTDVENRLSIFPDDSLGYGWGGVVNGHPVTGGFIPWRFRLLMAPLMHDNLQSNSFRVGGFYTEAPVDNMMPLMYRRYWESQILGPVSLDNVESFEFTGTPPSGEFLQELQQRGITIYDGRQSPAVVWTP